MKNGKGNKIQNIVHEKCPCCGEGTVFLKKKRSFLQLPEMNQKCSACGYSFEREPGYFIGAMYVSYGLAVFEGLAAFLLTWILSPEISPVLFLSVIISVIILFSFWNFRLGRMIWMYLFPG